MFMQVGQSININDIEKGFKVVLFDNRKGEKDHNVKLVNDLRLTFNRIVRAGCVMTNNNSTAAPGDDTQYVRYHDTPHSMTGFKIENVNIFMEPSTDGKVGRVIAIIRPFGPRYVELRDKIENNPADHFKLLHTVDKEKNVYRVLAVAHDPKQSVFNL